MNKTIKLLHSRDIARLERKKRRQFKVCASIASIATAIAIVALCFMFTGCGTTGGGQGPIAPAALQATVMLGTQFGLESHPEATPAVRVAATTVCSVAAGTNIAPAEIVAALSAAGVTNNYARLIVNSALAAYNVAFAYYQTNIEAFHPYTQALCDGLTQGLPPAGPTTRALVTLETALPPHLH